MISLLNVGSLVLGLLAWTLPIITLTSVKKNWFVYSFVSLSACIISLYFQVLYHHHLVKIEDWGAIMDISGGLVFITSVLIAVTMVLNGMTMMKYRKAKQ